MQTQIHARKPATLRLSPDTRWSDFTHRQQMALASHEYVHALMREVHTMIDNLQFVGEVA